jgi:muconolactone D-isomerase
MLFKVEMTVNPPKEMSADQFDSIKLVEKEYSEELQRQGTWCHIWRVVGQYANVSIFDVTDNSHLHEILMKLPLYPYMDVAVTPLCAHPSSIK